MTGPSVFLAEEEGAVEGTVCFGTGDVIGLTVVSGSLLVEMVRIRCMALDGIW